MEYYTYIYLDTRKPGKFTYGELTFEFEPFYVGKGKGRRFERTYKEAIGNRGNKYRHHKIRSIIKQGFEPIILKVFENLSEQESFDKEIELIKAFNKYLTNLTNGGDGTSGRIVSQESRDKSSISNKKNWTEDKKKEQSEKMKVSIKPEDIKRRIELRKLRGTNLHSEETKQLMKGITKNNWLNPEYREKVMSNRAKALSEGRGKRKSNYTKDELRIRHNEGKRKRRIERRNNR